MQSIRDGQDILDITIEYVSFKLEEVGDGLEVVKDQNNIIINGVQQLKEASNATLEMLMDKNDEETRRLRAEKRMDEDKNCRLQAKLAAEQQQNAYLRGMLRSVSPANQSAWGPPPPPPPPQTWAPYIDQDRLWQLLHISDIDIADMDLISAKEQLLPRGDVARAQQIVHDTHSLFESWLVSPTSTRLLVHGNFSGLMLQTSALSSFCATLTKAFRARKRYLCLVWFCGRHLGSGSSHSEADDDDSDTDDDASSGSEDGYGDFYSDETRLQPLKAMLRSLIAQLLCDHDFGSGNLLAGASGIDPERVEAGSLLHLRRLLGWLVRQLPEEMTLFLLLDGVCFYERDEFVDPLLDVLGDVLGLAGDESVGAAVKVLLTSPWPTSVVRAAFEYDGGGGWSEAEESLILAMESLPPIPWVSSSERLSRDLAGVEEVGGGDMEDSDSSDG